MSDTLSFGTAPIPATTVGRNAEPNPFDGHFPTPGGQALTVTLPGTAEANKEKITNLQGKARRAAHALETPMTARVHVGEEGTGSKAVTVLSVWTVGKISRPRTDKPAE